MSETAPRTERTDYQATSDPALLESADRGSKLLDYGQLYELWERQQWATQDIDFTQDRIDWHERIDPEERFQRMYGLSSFFIGEQRVAAELGPMMRAAPQEDMRIFLCTQIADEARHVAFFDRFYSEVGVLESDNLQDRLEENVQYINKEFGVLFDEMLHSRVDRLAVEPEDLETLVETVTIYHMVIEGMLALTGQHFIMDYNERVGTLPGFVEGFTKVARDEHRHVAFGARFLRDMARRDPRYIDAIQRTLVEVGPVADGVLKPPWMEGGDDEADAVRRLGRRDARLRDEGARAADEGHRPAAGRMSTPEIDFDQFLAVDMRVGRVTAVDDFPEARKPAWKLTIDFGPEIGVKRSSAQISEYAREELEGRLVVAVVNFPPRQIGPFMSQVLTLGASDEDGRIILLQPEADVPVGARIH